jgi:hypothetical protein
VNNRACLVMALVALLPGAASAQVTTFVAPSHKSVDSAKAVVATAARAAADTSRRTTLTNMKAWVDSAAATVAARPAAPAAAPAAAPTRDTTAHPAAPRPSATTTFKNGAPAPATASALPLIALVGLAALSIGTVMVASRDRA